MALWLLNLADELTRDVTPDQWAEIKAVSEATKHGACCGGAHAERRVPHLQ